MTRILMPVDGSEHDAKTAAFLGKLFRGLPGTEVVALYVAHLHMPTPPAVGLGSVPLIPSVEVMEQWEREIREEAQAAVSRAEAELRHAGLAASSRVTFGMVADVIVRTAQEEGFDLIAMGSRGAGQITGIFLGSVSDRVTHRSKVPVLIVH